MLHSKQSDPVRVLHVFGSLDRGGAETMVMNIYRSVDREKVQFDFVVNQSCSNYAYEDEIQALGGFIYRIPRYNIYNIFKYKRAWKRLLREHPECEIVHGHHTAPASVYIPIAKEMGRVTIAHGHTSFIKENSLKLLLRKTVLYPVRYQADCLFACSELAGKWMFGAKADYHIINNAINTSDFAFDQGARDEKRAELNIGKSLLIGHVGRFMAPKNHKFLVKIFHEMCKLHSDVKLLLIGDGPLRPETENMAKNLGIQDRVIFAGVRSDIPELLSAIDVFLFPSLHEGFPVTLVEAQANGLPIVASTAISDEVKITDLVEFIPLDQGADYWAEQVLKISCERKECADYSSTIKTAGYDVNSNSKWLEKFYVEKLNRG